MHSHMSKSPRGFLISIRVFEIGLILGSPVVAQLQNTLSTEFGRLFLRCSEVLSLFREGKEVASVGGWISTRMTEEEVRTDLVKSPPGDSSTE